MGAQVVTNEDQKTPKFFIVVIAILIIAAGLVAYLLYRSFSGGETENSVVVRQKSSIFSSNQDDAAETETEASGEVLPPAGLTFTNCEPTPHTLVVPLGTPIKVTNQGPEDVTIILSREEKYEIAADSTLEINPLFSYGPGNYSYGGCGASTDPLGVFIVTQ